MSGPPASSFTPGFNYKIGTLNKKCNGFFKWGLRFVVLDRQRKLLYYYHSHKDQSPSETINLQEGFCTVGILGPEDSPGHGFRISSRDSGRDYVFVSNNQQTAEEWFEAIRQVKAHAPLAKSPTAVTVPLSPSQTFGSVRSANLPPLPQSPRQNQNGADSPRQMASSPSNMTALPSGSNSGQASGTSTGSTLHGNSTTVQNGTVVGADATLVSGGANRKVASQTMVAILTMIPDNKKIPPVEVDPSNIIKIGRYVSNTNQADNFVAFKSKVISRNHAEVWSVNGEVYIRDTGSQSGTFLNAMRLSESGKESKPYRIRTGDTVQFGVDYKNAEDDNSRCISVKIDIRTKIEGGSEDTGGTSSERNTNATLIGGGNATTTTLVNHNGSGVNQATLIAPGANQPTLVASVPPYGPPPQIPNVPQISGYQMNSAAPIFFNGGPGIQMLSPGYIAGPVASGPPGAQMISGQVVGVIRNPMMNGYPQGTPAMIMTGGRQLVSPPPNARQLQGSNPQIFGRTT